MGCRLAKPFLSIVIPAFNEEARIIHTLERVECFLREQSYTWEVMVVDDGSTDDTLSLVSEWVADKESFRVESIPHTGKGWAVRHGMLTTSGKYRFMCDTDLATPIEMLPVFLDQMSNGYDVVIGSRQIEGARRFHEPAYRHVMGRVFNKAVKLLAVGGFQDTQCGFKCFRGEVADHLFRRQRVKGWGFDVEILYLASKREMRVLEIPVDWYHQEASKVRAGIDSVTMLRDVALVRWNDLNRRYKDTVTQSPVTRTGSRKRDRERGRSATPSKESLVDTGKKVVIIIPTYNEAENLPELVSRLFALNIPNTKLIVVDDNSPDGTAQVAYKLADRFPGNLEIIERQSKQGLGTAYLEGFARALEDGADYVLQMDADLSHAPEYVPAFVNELEHADVVVGSRYTNGGGVDESWGLKRRLLSGLANWGIRRIAGLRVKDATSGFKAYRSSALRGLEQTQFRCKGFGFQVEVAHACQRRGYTIVEHPIIFFDRTVGRSKMSPQIMFEAFWRLSLLRLKSR